MSRGTIHLDLPYCPSVNHYYGRTRTGQMFIKPEGVAFRQTVVVACKVAQIRPLAGNLEMTLQAFPPDRRKRDLSNLYKCLEDAMQHAGCFADDVQIRCHRNCVIEHFSERHPVGRMFVTVQPWQRDPGQIQLTLIREDS